MGAVAGCPILATFDGDASLRTRPMRRILDPLEKFGARTIEQTEGGRLPLTMRGALDPIPVIYEVPVPSAQVKSAVLLAGLAAPGTAAAEHERYAFGDMVLDLTCRELSTAGSGAQELTTAEFNLLEIFVKRPNRVLSRDNIMDLLKGHEWSPVDRSIDALVGRLRKKVDPDADLPRLIKTVRGVGYVFTADVKRL